MTPRIYKELRGRPGGRTPKDYYDLMSIALIASKYDLDPKVLIVAIFEALEKKISQCKSLKICCRKVNRDSATFLIAEDQKVVWQFPINLVSIRNPDFRDSITKISIPEKIKKNDELGRNLNIDELKLGMKGINVTAKITEIPPTKSVITRWGSEALVSNIKMIDETGSIRLALWNQQIGKVHIGDEIEIKNCNVISFAEKTQLKLGRKSTMLIFN